MKKTLAILLALIMILSVALVSCNNKKPSSSIGDDDPDNDFVAQSKATDTGDDSNTSNTDNAALGAEFVEFTSTKTLWVMSDVYLRSEPSTSSSSKIGVETGTELVADAKNDSWFRITYNGETRYVSADYVTETQSEAVFTKFENDSDRFTLTIKSSGVSTSPNQINLRSAPVFDSTRSTKTVKETEVTASNPLTVIGKNGNSSWYIVLFNGTEYYLAITSVTTPLLVGLPSNNSGNFGG